MTQRHILITGGAGFIGANTAVAFLRDGWHVTVLDNLSRRGSLANLEWVRAQGDIVFHEADLRDQRQLEACFQEPGYDYILHCAAQVAVTTSVADPREDFEINALGTFNLLEAVRARNPEALLVYASTNKVYGNMEHLDVQEHNGRYEYANLPEGVGEDSALDFHSPYGCSKGAADQYVRDYARIYGLTTVCFRQSCIYGYRQFGVEDQGWVAWFIIAHALGRPVTIFGDGKQTRDVLFIDDLVEAYRLAYQHRDAIGGQILNIGGGPTNLLSLLELIEIIRTSGDSPLDYSFADWRPGDQRVFVADIRKAAADLGWSPRHDCRSGIDKLMRWVADNRQLFL